MIKTFKLFKSFSTFKNMKGSEPINRYITGNKNTIVLDFYSSSCKNCSALAPKLEEQLKDKNYEVIKISTG